MSRAKDSTSWQEVLEELKSFVAKEYPNGGKLPPALVMTRKLGTANKTYAKALKALCTHGIARTSRGRSGTAILPKVEQARKAGVLIPRDDYPMLSSPTLHAKLALELDAKGISIQLARTASPEKTLLELKIHNIALLLAIVHWHAKPEFEIVEHLKKQGFPALPLIMDLPAVSERFRDAGLPALSSGVHGNAKALAGFLLTHGCKRLMRLSGAYDRNAELIDAGLKNFGLELPKKFCAPLNSSADRIAEKIRKNAIDAVFVEGVQYEEVWRALRRFPEPERPWLICHTKSKVDALARKFPEDSFFKVALTTCDFAKAAREAAALVDAFFQSGEIPGYKEIDILGVERYAPSR